MEGLGNDLITPIFVWRASGGDENYARAADL
jgi:hypothetical protein